MKKKDEGFTLVELLIVIVILGILATVVVFAVRGITDQGRDSACETDKRTVEVALESYWALEGYEGNDEVTQEDLVNAGLMRDESENVEINGTEVEFVGDLCGG